MSSASALYLLTGYEPWTQNLLVVDENGYACGPKMILYLLVVEEHGYDLFSRDG
jgi:hypothetical protein